MYIHTGPSMLTMTVDGRALELQDFKYSPYEASRRSKPVIMGGHAITVTSSVRMAWNTSALLWSIELSNQERPGIPPDMIGMEDYVHQVEFSAVALAREVGT